MILGRPVPTVDALAGVRYSPIGAQDAHTYRGNECDMMMNEVRHTGDASLVQTTFYVLNLNCFLLLIVGGVRLVPGHHRIGWHRFILHAQSGKCWAETILYVNV